MDPDIKVHYVVKYTTNFGSKHTHESNTFTSLENAQKLLNGLHILKNKGDRNISSIEGLYKVQERKIGLPLEQKNIEDFNLKYSYKKEDCQLVKELKQKMFTNDQIADILNSIENNCDLLPMPE